MHTSGPSVAGPVAWVNEGGREAFCPACLSGGLASGWHKDLTRLDLTGLRGYTRGYM